MSRPHWSGRLILATLALTLISCAEARDLIITEDIVYFENEELDVIRPNSDDVLPAVVLVHGAGLDRRSYRPLAEAIARRGAVAFVADWSVLPPMRTEGLEEIACAVRYARAHAEGFGADPKRVTLVGHSSSGAWAGRVATDGDSFLGACTEETSALPDSLVLISSATVPGGDPWHEPSLGGNPELEVVLIHGVQDEVVSLTRSRRTEDALTAAGYDVTLYLVAGGHYDIVLIDPAIGEGEANLTLAEPVIDIILEIAG